MFLHRVKEGPANQSYGLQVAGLAGVPQSVIARARRYLVELEQQSASHRASLTPQRELELESPPTDALRAALEALAPDELTPREALDALYRLKALD